MALSYETVAGFRAVKMIVTESAPGDAEIAKYLLRATGFIDRTCRRRFFPYYAGRSYGVNINYQDLANRALITQDLDLQADLLEVDRIETGDPVSPVDTLEVLLSALAPNTTTFVLSDVDGSDQIGQPRIAVGYILQVGGEYMYVVDVDPLTNTVQVIRRMFVNGIMPTRMAAGTKIYRLKATTLQLGVDSFLLDFNVDPKFGIRVIWPRTFAGQYGSISAKYRSPTIYVTGFWGYNEHYIEQAWVNTLQTLGAAVDADDEEFVIEDDVGLDDQGFTAFIVGQLYRIDNELLECTEVTPGVIPDDPDPPIPPKVTFRRGRNGSVAVEHEEGALIFRWRVLDEVKEACFAIAKAWRESDMSAGGRQGVSDVSVGVPFTMPPDAAETIKRLTRDIM